MRETVAIAAHNLRGHEPAPLDGAPSTNSPFARELEIAEWLDHRVDHEIAYLESCRERVREAQALTDLRLKQLAAEHARIANLLTVLQTSLLGAAVATFGVASALGWKFSLTASVRAPVMALVASMALVLPSLAARWPNGYAWPELTGAAVVGAAAGWVLAVSAGEIAAHPANPVIVLASAALGAATFAVAARLANDRRSSKHRQPGTRPSS